MTLVSTSTDLYVAEATLLRHIGLLEERSILTGTGVYDPEANFRHAAGRASLPYDPAIRALDRIARPEAIQRGLETPPLGPTTPVIAAANGPPLVAQPASNSPNSPLPGTTGAPPSEQRMKHP